MSVDTFEQTETLNIPDYACQGFIAVAGARGLLSEWVEVTGYHVDAYTVAVYGTYRFPLNSPGFALGMLWTCDDIDPMPIEVNALDWPVMVTPGDTLVIKFGP